MASSTMDDALLSDVKLYVGITWEEEGTDRNVRNLINLGIAYIDDKLGAAGDYAADGFPRTLLFEYVRYARDGALDVFETNYLSMILAMQNDRSVKQYAEKNAVSAGE